MDFRKKLPIVLDHTFMCYIMHRYSKEPRLYIVPSKFLGASKIKEKETYWLAEDYALIDNSYIAYRADYISRDDFEWKPSTDMEKNFSRYGIECHKIETKKLKTIKKAELVKSGVTSEEFTSLDDTDITKEFENRPKEFWRFRKRWQREFEDQIEWDDSTEMLIFHFEIHRLKPEFAAFNWRIEERLNQQKRELEFRARPPEPSESSEEGPGTEKKRRKKSTKKKKARTAKISSEKIQKNRK